jgi:hypothetical protein
MGGIEMAEVEKLIADIEALSNNLKAMIGKKQLNLQDPEVFITSQVLDAAILKYSEIIESRLNLSPKK